MTGRRENGREAEKKRRRLIGVRKESEGVKMTLIERWNDAIWRKK